MLNRMRLGLRVIAVLLAMTVWGPVTSQAAPPKGPDVGQKLTEFDEAQKAVAAQIVTLQEQVKALEAQLTESRQQQLTAQEGIAADREVVKQMREEVRGLYVESSSTKEMVEKVGNQVEALSGRFEGYRSTSGFLMALVLVIQVVGVLLFFFGRN